MQNGQQINIKQEPGTERGNSASAWTATGELRAGVCGLTRTGGSERGDQAARQGGRCACVECTERRAFAHTSSEEEERDSDKDLEISDSTDGLSDGLESETDDFDEDDLDKLTRFVDESIAQTDRELAESRAASKPRPSINGRRPSVKPPTTRGAHAAKQATKRTQPRALFKSGGTSSPERSDRASARGKKRPASPGSRPASTRSEAGAIPAESRSVKRTAHDDWQCYERAAKYKQRVRALDGQLRSLDEERDRLKTERKQADRQVRKAQHEIRRLYVHKRYGDAQGERDGSILACLPSMRRGPN